MNQTQYLIDNFNGELYDLCYEILDNEKDEAKIFEFVCVNFKKVPKDGTLSLKAYFTKSEIDEFESIYGDTINGLLNSAIKKCNLGVVEPDKFYSSLWQSYCALFSTKKEKAFAFYYTLIDTSIPYHYLGKPISMSNEHFKELVEKNKSSIDKVLYIARSNYSQRTEKASLLLNCLDEIEDAESKAVVLSQAIPLLNPEISHGRLDIEAIVKQIDKQIDEKIETVIEDHPSKG